MRLLYVCGWPASHAGHSGTLLIETAAGNTTPQARVVRLGDGSGAAVSQLHKQTAATARLKRRTTELRRAVGTLALEVRPATVKLTQPPPSLPPYSLPSPTQRKIRGWVLKAQVRIAFLHKMCAND